MKTIKTVNAYKKSKIKKFKSYLIRLSELHNDSERHQNDRIMLTKIKKNSNYDISSVDEDES
jgi:hypothetical protein